MAQRHSEFLERGARVFAVSADSPPQNASVVERLALPFPILSDPDREQAINPLGFADEKDPRQISRPGTVIITPEGEIVFSITGRDYADRPDEDDLLAQLDGLELAPTTQQAPVLGEVRAGENAVAVTGLPSYLRGAKFAALAIRSRYREFGDEFRDDTKAYVQMVERYMEALTQVEVRRA